MTMVRTDTDWQRRVLALLRPLRWVLYFFSVAFALLWTWGSYGHWRLITELVLFGLVLGCLMCRFAFWRRMRPLLLPWTIGAALTILALGVDVVSKNRLYLWWHAHNNIFLGGGAFIEDRDEGRVFMGGFIEPYYYLLRGRHNFRPEFAQLPDEWRNGDPIPDALKWEPWNR